MVDHDVATNKLDLIGRYIDRIREKFVSRDLFLSDRDCQELILFNLHQAIQAVMDLGSHILADEGLGVPKQGREIFQILKDSKIITTDLSNCLMPMVGFRNILIHEYVELNFQQIADSLDKDIGDIEEFRRQIAKYARL